MLRIPRRSTSIPISGQHEEDVYYVRVFPRGGGGLADTNTYRRRTTPTADSDGFAHGDG